MFWRLANFAESHRSPTLPHLPLPMVSAESAAGPSRLGMRFPRAASPPGPSRPPAVETNIGEFKPPEEGGVEVDAYGLNFWEYRRACFLAGQPWPITDSGDALPETYTVAAPPEPMPADTAPPDPGSSIARLEAVLAEFGAEESDVAWNGGVGGVHRNLSGGKKLAKRLRLGLVIKVLRAGWLRDGTWPLDPKTSRAAVPPPDSPLQTAADAAGTATATTAAAAAAPGADGAEPAGAPPGPADPPHLSLAPLAPETPHPGLLPIPVRAGEPLAMRRS
ncbi:uncharacterized protein LOC62_03G004360 [Vanrija pseudolonga]|uniref:Uncharacterized protein n=1 Tax=Vanrija pseudolonga TaxID=143232 RepID=A0AAF1BHV3_9TREE|nr:hypothetical protein LOC62_03G004360 [Vanrija pseudolonga]